MYWPISNEMARQKDVYILTNYDLGPSINFKIYNGQIKTRPYPIVQYNSNKGAVDLINQYTAYYSNDHKTYKYWFRIFVTIMDISIYNAYIINSQLCQCTVSL